MTDRGTPSASEWRLHWATLIACVAGITLSTSQGYTLGVMIAPLEQEFGWTRAEISSGPLIVAIFALFAAPFVGIAVDRFGPRRIGIVGVIIFCSALALLSTATADIASWWALYSLMAVAAIMVAPIVWTAAITRLFVKNRGLALAIALCGTGVGSALIPRLTFELVEAYGWRGAYMSMGALFAVIVLPLVVFFFKHPALNARETAAAHSAPLTGVGTREGLTSWRFIRLAAASTVISFAVTAMIANAVPILASEGIERGEAASIAGLVGIGAIIGRLCGGYLLDRLNANYVAAVAVLAPIITCAILIFAPGDITRSSIAFLILGLAVGTELDAVAYLAARHFGVKSFGALFGVMNGLMIFANGVAPLLANHVYDVTRSYEGALWALIPACVIASLLFATLGKYPALDGATERSA